MFIVKALNMFTERLSPEVDAFVDNVPEELALDVVRMLRGGFRSALASVSDLTSLAAHDLYPHKRRADIQTAIRQLNERYAQYGVSAAERLNAGGNASHIEIVAGKTLLMLHAVGGENALVRQAVYRNVLLADPQSRLFDLDDQPVSVPDETQVAVVLYGPTGVFPKSFENAGPGFVVVRFPLDGWTGYSASRLDLLARLTAFEKGQQYENGPRLKRISELA